MLAGGLDRLDDSVCEFAVLESNRQLRGDLVPETGRHLLIDSTIAEDRETIFFRGDEEQDAVAQRGLCHAETLEGELGELADVGSRFRLHVDADLAGGLLL